MKVELENLTKRWGNVTGADSMNLDIKDGEFVAFLGPSGCGKTTTLLMVAGIYKPSAGYIRFDGREVNKMAPKDRNIGMVFQSYALYPHMTVFKNISYPLKLKKVPVAEMQERTQSGRSHGHRASDGPQTGPAIRRTAAAGGSGPGAG